MAFVRATVALPLIARTITAPILLLSLAQCGFVGGFFPTFAILCLKIFLSVAAVLCLLLPPPARGDVGSC